MKRLVIIHTATGAILGTWSGGAEQSLDLPSGREAIILDPDEPMPAMSARWDDTQEQFVAGAVPPPQPAVVEEQLWRIETKLDELLSK